MSEKIELPYSWHSAGIDSKLTQVMEKLLEIERRLDDADREKEREDDRRRERREGGIG